ncbi:hypothetical protein GCM10029992_16020 [Glycomyces albus]
MTAKNPGSATTGFDSPESSVPGSVWTSHNRAPIPAPHTTTYSVIEEMRRAGDDRSTTVHSELLRTGHLPFGSA